MNNEIIIFENQDVKLEVNMKDETVWLSLDQMAKLFNRDKSVISRHIKNALEAELEDEVVVANFATTTKHGAIKGKTQTKEVEYYNLDMILSVGYRVKSKNGIIFRKWANKILKDYLIKGYAVNEKRLEYLEKTVKLIDIASRNLEGLDTVGASDIIKVLQRYTKSLNLLDDYDHKSLTKPKGNINNEKINYKNCIDIIKTLKFNEASDLFAIERDKGLESIINNIYQTFDGADVYESIEEKAANFLYACVKNHVFIDGNKRIAATLFIYFLQFYGILYVNGASVIDNNTLASLTLLIAESNPKEKEILTQLIMNFLTWK
mgnify:CR=1 FL=1